MFDLIHFADFWASVGTFFGMCLLTVFVVRYVMQREQLRDQWFMGCLGTITVLLPSAVFQSVGRLSGDAPFAHSSEVSLNCFCSGSSFSSLASALRRPRSCSGLSLGNARKPFFRLSLRGCWSGYYLRWFRFSGRAQSRENHWFLPKSGRPVLRPQRIQQRFDGGGPPANRCHSSLTATDWSLLFGIMQIGQVGSWNQYRK